MTRVPLRVHGPYRHRSQWRLDIFEDGKRSKQSYATYRDALLAASAILTAPETSRRFRVSAAETEKVE